MERGRYGVHFYSENVNKTLTCASKTELRSEADVAIRKSENRIDRANSQVLSLNTGSQIDV